MQYVTKMYNFIGNELKGTKEKVLVALLTDITSYLIYFLLFNLYIYRCWALNILLPCTGKCCTTGLHSQF